MEDIMIIRSSFMRRIISQIINKALKKQMPGVEVELKDIQANWLDKEQKVHLHLELNADVTKAQLNDILKNTFYGSRVDEEGMPCLVLDYNTPPKWLGY